MEDKKELKVKQMLDGITSPKPVTQDEITEDTKKKHNESRKFSLLEIEVTTDKIPQRGILWYILFCLSFIGLSAITIYLSEWVALFFVVVASFAIVWHGHSHNRMKLEVGSTGVIVNGREFIFEQIDRYYFSEMGDDIALNLILAKKRFPILTFILLNSDDFEKLRDRLTSQIPETEPRGESMPDFIIRTLKL